MQPSLPVTPPDRFWRVVHYPPVTLVIGLAFVMLGGVTATAMTAIVARAIRSSGFAQAGLEVLGNVASTALLVVCVVLAYRLFNRFVERRSNVELPRAGGLRELGAGIVAGFLLFSAVIGTIALFGGYRITGFNGIAGVWAALAIGFGPGFIEEIITRGLIFRLIEQWLGSWPALAISAALFGAAHLGNEHATLLAGSAIAIEAGVMLAAAYMLTRRLWAAIGLHASWNFTQGGIYSVPVSGFAEHGLFAQTTAGPALLTGGAFGAEASLPAIVICTAFGIVLLLACVRRDRIVPFLPRRAAQRLTAAQE